MSKQKRKGTAWETEIVKTLNEAGWPHVERRTVEGVNDRGDIAGLPGLVIEAKDHGQLRFSEWLVEAERERINAHAEFGVVWAKRRGKASAKDAYVVMTGDQFIAFIRKAGW